MKYQRRYVSIIAFTFCCIGIFDTLRIDNIKASFLGPTIVGTDLANSFFLNILKYAWFIFVSRLESKASSSYLLWIRLKYKSKTQEAYSQGEAKVLSPPIQFTVCWSADFMSDALMCAVRGSIQNV